MCTLLESAANALPGKRNSLLGPTHCVPPEAAAGEGASLKVLHNNFRTFLTQSFEQTYLYYEAICLNYVIV